MRSLLAAAAALTLLAGPALAQQAQHHNPPAASGPGNEAIRSGDGNTATAPVEGRNSFTEGQARSRIEANGFSSVSELRKDDTGIWRGRAVRDGRTVDVSLDFQGNVIAR